MTLQIDDAGVGDLLSGVVIGIYRPETERFDFEVVGVKYFQNPKFKQKAYLREAASTALRLVRSSAPGEAEAIEVCSSFILADAVKQLKKVYGESRVKTVKIIGKAQDKTEQAYLDEIRKLGYNPLPDRDARRARSFFHMLRWVRKDRSRLRHAKTGWPRLRRYIRL